MHLHWERSHNTAGDCNIRSLSWMGRVPDEIPQEEGWKLNRNHYYQEGWLSTANLRGVVGVTYTTSHCGLDGSSQLAPPSRTNFNLRGHRAEVTLVRWNEPYQKLASCDTSGIIFVWIKYEGRWSIELINDRSTPVICFSWSHDGRMALICYQDGFVLVGSVAGQRYWSTMLPPDVSNITSGVWTPDDQHVYLGTTQGDILVMDLHGNTVGKTNLRPGVAIAEMAWNCERFNMEEQPEHQNNLNIFPSSNNHHPKQPQPYLRPDGRPFVMAACLKNGEILLLRSYDDVIPTVLHTGFQNYCVDWTNSGELLAVAGKSREFAVKSNHTIRYENVLHFYNDFGTLVYKIGIPSQMFPVSAVTWGHNDKRLFVATGNEIHIGWVSPSIGSLQLLSRLKIHNSLKSSDQVQLLPLPCRLQNLIGMLFTQTIRCCIPDPENLRNFVIKPQLPENTRLHCTMIRHSEKGLSSVQAAAEKLAAQSSAVAGSAQAESAEQNSYPQQSAYTLYLEHLGGFLPLLKGRRVSKIRPEFTIYDPQLPIDRESGQCSWHHVPNLPAHLKRLHVSLNENSDAETTDDETASPRGRRRRNRRRPPHAGRYGFVSNDPPDYMNILPEEQKLAEITSNIWGTKFKIVGTNQAHLPLHVGQINYKASLLHLQPRQMRLEITDLKEESLDPLDELNNEVDDLSWFDEDQQSEDGGNRSRSGSAAMFLSDEDEESDKVVTMKDDILTAVTDFGPKVPNVAPIAPLPSRLSFCLSPQRQQHLDAILSEAEHNNDAEPILSSAEVNCMAAVKRSPTVAPSVVPRILSAAKHDVIEAISTIEVAEVKESPSKRKLRMSVSCDNYLGDGKFSLSRRDSVGSGSPHSSKGSPLRWATKADEIAMTTSVTSAYSPLRENVEKQRSCSANELDAIVDILGVPSELLSQRDFNKRLFLLKADKQKAETKVIQRRNNRNNRNNNSSSKKFPLEIGSKSKSCEEEEENGGQDLLVEVKRRSIYAKDCRGRTEAQACNKCQVVAQEVQDIELNREMFDIVDTKHNPEEDQEKCVNLSEELTLRQDEEMIQIVDSADAKPVEPATAAVDKKAKRRFDSVRSLLEKARLKLMTTKQRWNRSRSRAQSQGRPDNSAMAQAEKVLPDVDNQSQSSPNTPAQMRKEKRHRSFSPVRTLLNSPMLRRKKKPCGGDSGYEKSADQATIEGESQPIVEITKLIQSEDTDSDEEELNKDSGHYHNLETFQKKKLKQKLKNLNNMTSGPYPSPPPAPQRVPHPRKNLQHSTGLLQPPTPLLPRRAINKGMLGAGLHPGATPNSTPIPTPNTKRRGLNGLLQQYHQNQIHVTDAEKKEALLLHKKRKRLILHNKAPMWNEASQVYQLDFGGRVTQESAKNFQIEYKGKQVMQFGRIDHNAYTLDFQYPFSAVQAFAVALANVTQRLK